MNLDRLRDFMNDPGRRIGKYEIVRPIGSSSSGSPLTLLGALTIGYLEKILSINAVGESSRLMLTGAIIVAAVLLQRQKNV